jgi:ABC-type lipoprotein release transport system permease subunit
MGVVGGTAGAVLGALFSIGMYSVAYGPATVLGALAVGRLLLYLAASVLAGMLLSMLAAIYPASVAARMVPSDALRTNV